MEESRAHEFGSKEEEGGSILLHRHEQHQLRNRRRRQRLCCCILVCAALVAAMAVVVAVLAALAKPKDPQISIGRVELQSLDLNTTSFLGSSSGGINLPNFTLSFVMWVSVKNPNRASFRYGNATSRILYHGDQVGEALIPAGRIRAQGVVSFPSSVTIHAARIIGNANLLPDIVNGSIPIQSATLVSGSLRLLNVFRHHATSSSSCSVRILLASRSVEQLGCIQKTKL